jgi:hypothetical protein
MGRLRPFGPKTRAFLAAIRQVPSITRAAKAAGISRELHPHRLKQQYSDDPEKRAYALRYKAAFEEAWEVGCNSLESTAIERCMLGVDEPVFYQGEECGYVTRYYHTEFLLRGAKPEKYRERIEHKVEPGEGMKKFAGTMEELLGVYRELTQASE